MENISSGHIDAFKIIDNKLYKQSTAQEYNFYKDLNDENSQYYKENQILKNFCANYFGESLENNKKYIILENLYYNLPNASSIDFKLGKYTYMPGSSEEKILNETAKSKASTGEELGFRIAGLQQKDSMGKITKKLSRSEAFKTIKKEDLESILTQLLKSNDAQINQQALSYYIEQLESLIKFFQEHSTRFFIASSIFLLCDNIQNKYVLKYIDFAHYGKLEKNKRDENVIEGLSSIMKIFKTIASKL